MHGTAATEHPDLLVGFAGSDDAGVFRLGDDVALVQSVDFFTPIVDDPELWGRIAAANALSDLYAMGAKPLTALQLLSWPRGELDWELAARVIEGGLAVLAEADCTLLGGHSIDDPEPKYGFAVTGTVHPDRIITNDAGEAGDVLVLTKPLGTGVITTALKAGSAPRDTLDRATALMTRLNREASLGAQQVGVVAGTDITGFGLLGHLREVADASGLSAVVDTTAVPFIDGAMELAAAGHLPGGSRRNLRAIRDVVDEGGVDETTLRLLADAQTNGGLLLAVPPERAGELVERLESGGDTAARIGSLEPRGPSTIMLTP